jgi:hypothetical protein
MRHPTPSIQAIRRLPASRKRRSGSALIVALWVILLLSLMIGSFAGSIPRTRTTRTPARLGMNMPAA